MYGRRELFGGDEVNSSGNVKLRKSILQSKDAMSWLVMLTVVEWRDDA